MMRSMFALHPNLLVTRAQGESVSLCMGGMGDVRSVGGRHVRHSRQVDSSVKPLDPTTYKDL